MTGCPRWRLNSFGSASPWVAVGGGKYGPGAVRAVTTTFTHRVSSSCCHPAQTGPSRQPEPAGGGDATGVNLYGAELGAKRSRNCRLSSADGPRSSDCYLNPGYLTAEAEVREVRWEFLDRML